MEGARSAAPGQGRFARVAEKPGAYQDLDPKTMAKQIAELEKRMYQHARDLEFEQAARLRDQIRQMREQVLVDPA